ncbi:unnamed protein product [Ixodes persulcatus]
MMNGVKSDSPAWDERTNGSTFLPPEHQLTPPPKEVDWRATLVTEVKDQGMCGACWAFSTTGSLEGQYARKTGRLVSLSEQNLVDCSDEAYNNHGCAGGLMDRAYVYIFVNGGIDTEESYPYEMKQGKCRFQRKDVGASLTGYVRIVPRNDEKLLEKAVAFLGPVSAAVFAKLPNFRFYAEGVYDDQGCSEFDVDHGVLIVGYGTTEKGQNYWLIKNSWGTKWGDHGYMKLAKDANNVCGISSLASVPLV